METGKESAPTIINESPFFFFFLLFPLSAKQTCTTDILGIDHNDIICMVKHSWGLLLFNGPFSKSKT